jgi:hypothetical protein
VSHSSSLLAPNFASSSSGVLDRIKFLLGNIRAMAIAFIAHSICQSPGKPFYEPPQTSGRRDSNPRPLEPHIETGVFGTIWQGVAQAGTTRHHEVDSICGRGFAGDEGAAEAGTGRHTIFSPGLPPGLPPRYHVSQNFSRWCVRRLREDEGVG